MQTSKAVRPIPICVFRNGTKILVGSYHDPIKREVVYRPLGGGIHFGESSEAALHREIREEIGAEIEKPKLLGVLENLYTFKGELAHEIVFVYDARFLKTAPYIQLKDLTHRKMVDDLLMVIGLILAQLIPALR
ncbi:NUDIX domain-containing protein [Candidatus Acetothermia bacterium]|nr:NUDIX domain-containing protein [Candidatus Acetothermia bacterium]MBI3644152.1 NUDIX domain-containing protein [Candidatus Acetothermia bacterium]